MLTGQPNCVRIDAADSAVDCRPVGRVALDDDDPPLKAEVAQEERHAAADDRAADDHHRFRRELVHATVSARQEPRGPARRIDPADGGGADAVLSAACS